MNRRLRVLFAGGLLTMVFSAEAQNMFSSPYSVYGIGLVNDNYSSLNRSLGGTGIGLQDDNNLNQLNPASYGSILSPVSHVFEIGTYLESNRVQTRSRSDSKSNGGLTHLVYWFKFKPWWASVVGISPYSSVSYNIYMNQHLAVGTEADYVYKGSGNITRLYSGNSFALTKNFSVGVNLSYFFGTINRSETVSGQDTEGSLTLTDKNFSRAFNIDFGAQYKINFAKRALIFGVVYDNKLTMKGKSTLILYNGNYDTLNTQEGAKSVYTLPGYVGAGVSLKSSRSVLSLDVKYTDWSSASYGDQNLSFRDVTRIAAGYAYFGNSRGGSYMDLIGFRAGFNAQPYSMNLKGSFFNTWGAAFGLTFPLFDGKSSVNLTYSHDRIGTLANDLVLQRSNKLILDVVIRDFWGIRRKFD